MFYLPDGLRYRLCWRSFKTSCNWYSLSLRAIIYGVSGGVFRRGGKKFAGGALAADLELGNFVEIEGFELPGMEHPRLHECYQDAHANPCPARCSGFAAFILIVTHSRGHPARGHTTGRPCCL